MQTSPKAVPTMLDADTASSQPAPNFQHRSSLDTFVIPGRTRLPSSRVSQPEPMDIQIVHRLLNPDSFKVPKGRKKHGWLSPKRRKSSALHEDTKPDVDTLIDATKKVPKILQGGDPIIIGHGQDSPPESREGQAQSSEERLRDSIDRPKDSSEGSRVTSTTWSSTSRRIFTNSSGCSQGQANSRFIEEYNVLAMKSGIPQLTAPADVAGGGMISLYGLQSRADTC